MAAVLIMSALKSGVTAGVGPPRELLICLVGEGRVSKCAELGVGVAVVAMVERANHREGVQWREKCATVSGRG